nr:MAG TPA: hypothetical protein [Caudoviricetes sp.]
MARALPRNFHSIHCYNNKIVVSTNYSSNLKILTSKNPHLPTLFIIPFL